jgi:hypothetical protein
MKRSGETLVAAAAVAPPARGLLRRCCCGSTTRGQRAPSPPKDAEGCSLCTDAGRGRRFSRWSKAELCRGVPGRGRGRASTLAVRLVVAVVGSGGDMAPGEMRRRLSWCGVEG